MNRRKLTRVLLESGCDSEVTNKQGERAADIARRKGQHEVVKILDGWKAMTSHNHQELVGKSVDDSNDDLDAIRLAPDEEDEEDGRVRHSSNNSSKENWIQQQQQQQRKERRKAEKVRV